ncbi:fibro-slime domain-containing protein [Blautia obeum]|uniref:Fibro-slime domain-containing protein n=2 Tax=Blautia obeum TaxID=40520 RepID=A0A3E5A2L8_9FIRM|nr:fibro-slime domain-containing protein [Blautia obeum]
MHIIGDVNMKRENNKKFKKRKRNQNRSLTCRVLSMMFAIVLFCSTVLINTDYVSQASSFDDMVDMVEVEEDSAAVDTSEDTGDDLDTDVNFESEEGTDETYSESDDFGSSDADFSSGENMFTDGTSESSAPAEEAAQPVSCIVNLKNETIEIKAEAPAGVLPNGTQMTVKAVENNTEDAEMTDQYNKLAAKITEQLQSQGKNLDGFLAYNVSFTDADGNPVEPAGKVNYSFTYKEASSPELTDPAASTVTAAMIRTNKETSELELTELKAEEDQLTVETNESRQLTKAAFQSAATAAFTFVWSSTPAADDNENNENKEENGEVNNEEVNADTNTENTEENGEETNTENNVENSEEEQNPEEAPDQEQTKMIRIITDEVNLRVAPSTEAEVIATVATDTQLPLIETVTGEDESTWYKVSYEETDAYVRSDMAEVVETEEQGTENEDANEEEADVQVEDEVTYSQTIGNVVVTATAAKNVLPGNAEFVVTPIVQETDPDQYAETETKLNEKAEEDGYEIAGFLAYDIYFQDSEGNKIEPVDGSVKVSMHYTEPSVPATVSEISVVSVDEEVNEEKNTNIDVMHFVEDQNGKVQDVVNMTEQGQANVETTTDGEIQKAEFNTESFSVFTITWRRKSGNTVEFSFDKKIHLVRQNDSTYTDLNSSVNATKSLVLETEDTNPVLYMSTITSSGINKEMYQLKESETTYRFIGAYIATTSRDGYSLVDSNKVTKLMGRKEKDSNSEVMKYQYKGDTTYRNLKTDQTVIFVYSNAKLTQEAKLYSENGIMLYASGQSTVNLTNIDILYTTSANDIIPTSVKDSESGNNYTYERTVVGIGEESVEVKALRRESSSSNSPIQYSEDGENWMDVGSNPVKFIYTADAKGEVPKTIKTADTRNLINISMANYSENQNYQDSFQFGSADYTGSEAVKQNLVEGYLKDGYPVLKKNGTSLNGLFDGTWDKVIPHTYVTGLNHLFSYDSRTGTYSYDSDKNYAYYDIDSSRNTEKNFIVYERSKDKGEGNRHVASFMPYSSWDDGASQNKFAFGMMISFEFLQPKNGKINGQDMVFSFSGDDDVWVFIDNKLVLDLGGVHERATGSINFANGEVYVNNQSNPTLGSVFNSDSDTFADYTSHSLKLFYMERGRGDSNCSIKFNLPPRPTNSIEIVKSLANSDKEKYTSTDFQFKAYLEDEEDRNQELVQYNAIPEGTPYRVKKNDSLTDEVRYVGANNIFTLKAGESAVFEGIDSGLWFYAEEVGILSDQFDRVDITDWKVTYHDLNEKLVETSNGKVPEQTETYLARSEEKTAGNAARVEFKNTCNVKNLRKLRITKKMNGLSTTDKFSFQVYLTGQNGQFIPYDGGYEVINKASKFLREGNASSQGIISDVAPDETIVIDQILSGTEFRVNEIEPDNSRYEKPIKEVKEGSCDVGTVTGSDGKIALKKDAHVIITNTLKVDLTVNKEWSDKNIKHSSIYAGLYKADGTPLKCVELNEDNQYRYVFGNVSSSDLVYELRPVTGNENAEFTINNNGYVKVEADKIIVAKANNTDTKYKVSYKKEVSEDGTKITQTITNTKIVTELNLIKVEKNNEKNLLKNAEFALYTANDNYTYEESNRVTGNIKTDSNGRATVNGLVPGKYVLKETKAPEGYSLSANVWQVLVRDNQSVEVTLNGVPVEKSDDGAFVIENIKLYSLPSTGGSGIYWYMIGGMVLMSAAAWILYKNKCREVLGK